MKRIISLSILLAALNSSLFASYSVAQLKANPNNEIAKPGDEGTNAQVAVHSLCKECLGHVRNPTIHRQTARPPVIIGAEPKQVDVPSTKPNQQDGRH